jgi:hypothetical protein
MRAPKPSTSSDPPERTKRATGAGFPFATHRALTSKEPAPRLRRSLLAKCSMSYPTPTNPYAQRWQSLLAENNVLQKEHLRIVASLTAPFSVQQMAQLEASAARLQNLSLKVHDLVDDWASDVSRNLSFLPLRKHEFVTAQPIRVR